MRIRLISMLAMAAVAVAATGCHGSTGGSETPTVTGAASTGTGNGIADLSADQIAATAVSSLTHNYPMRLRGTVTTSSGVVTFDLVRNFQDGQGTVQFPESTYQIMRLGGHDYIKADAQFWTNRGPDAPPDPAAAERADGKWVRADLYSTQLPVGTFLDLHDNIWEAIVNDTNLTKGDRQVINGNPVIALNGNVGTVYVATEGTPNVIRVEAPNGARVDYSDHGKPVAIEEPPADQIVDLDVVVGTNS